MMAFAQNGINYKALIKDGSGNVVANQSITIQLSILVGAAETLVYQETHTPTTDTNGIAIVNIGEGTPDSGDFNTIDWGSDTHFLNVQINTGDGLTDLGTTQFMAVPYALNAKSVDSCGLSIGDSYQGGIIFYLDSTGCHGLVCAPTDQATNIPASVGGHVPHSINNGIGAGYINTEYIVGIRGDGYYAAKICYDLSLGGFDDWYLPSKYESELILLNIGGAAPSPNTNIGNFSVGMDGPLLYWSSTSYTTEQDFDIWVTQLAGVKIYYNTLHYDSSFYTAVRAIRAF